MRKHTLNIEAYTNEWLTSDYNSKRWQVIFDAPNAILRNSFGVSTEMVWPDSMSPMQKHFDGGITGEQVRRAMTLSYRVETRVTRGPVNTMFLDMRFFKKEEKVPFFEINLGVSAASEVRTMRRHSTDPHF